MSNHKSLTLLSLLARATFSSFSDRVGGTTISADRPLAFRSSRASAPPLCLFSSSPPSSPVRTTPSHSNYIIYCSFRTVSSLFSTFFSDILEKRLLGQLHDHRTCLDKTHLGTFPITHSLYLAGLEVYYYICRAERESPRIYFIPQIHVFHFPLV